MTACDVVVSLVPFVFHVKIIKAAIALGKIVVTTSYASPAIRALENDARDAGIVMINEVGVDPGVDHLYAIKTIDEVHREGGKVSAEVSPGTLCEPFHQSRSIETSTHTFSHRSENSTHTAAVCRLQNAQVTTRSV